MRRLAPALLLVFILALIVPSALADVSGPLLATVSGPVALAPSQSAVYNLTISGGPSDVANYTVTYYLTAGNTSGATPLQRSPGSTKGNTTAFRLNVTAPGVQGSITLVATVEALQKSGTSENVTTSFAITVVQPISLKATFHNSASTVAVNVTVRWYIDNAPVGTSLIRQIAANGDATVTFNYLPVGLSVGQHTVTVAADLDHDGVIDPARGEVMTSTLFYNQAQPLSTGWIILLGIGVFIPVFLGVVAVRRRGQR